MKQYILLLLLCVATSLFAQSGDEDTRISNEFIVLLKPSKTPDDILKTRAYLHIKRCVSSRMNIWLISSDSTNVPETILLNLRRDASVKLAQYNHRMQSRSLIPDDSLFVNQWNMLNTGQGGGTIGADIDATDAWALNHNNTTVAGDSIVIAIIDGDNFSGGFDLTHRDLNFFTNRHEIPNNGIDDDGDGYVDDYYGWNVFTNNDSVNQNGTYAHAMHCSGIAAAIGNNNRGIAGVCWGAQILRVVGSSQDESTVVSAYDYIIALRSLYNSSNGTKGAFVVSTNSSFGIDAGNPADYPIWCAMYDSLGFVGILSAAATTNNPWNVDAVGDIPTACPSNWLISVTNTTSGDQLNNSAGYGKINIDLGAPGTNIWSTVASNGYNVMSGTSMASPHLAGTVGAMLAAACPKLISDYKLYPDSIALIVKQMILSGATQLSDLYNKTVSNGRLDLYHALLNLNNYNCNNCNFSLSLSETPPACSDSCNGSALATVTGSGNYSYLWSNGEAGTNLIEHLCPGFYSLTVSDGIACQETANFSLFKPDSIVVSAIHTIPASDGDSGNIIVTASAGNYNLQYSLNGINYGSSSTIVVGTNGDYTVYIKNNVGCVITENVTVSGIADPVILNSLNLFPNPADGLLHICLATSKSTAVKFDILNILGEELMGETRSIEAGLHTSAIYLSAIPDGAYLLRISGDGFSEIKRFVVSR